MGASYSIAGATATAAAVASSATTNANTRASYSIAGASALGAAGSKHTAPGGGLHEWTAATTTRFQAHGVSQPAWNILLLQRGNQRNASGATPALGKEGVTQSGWRILLLEFGDL